MGISHRDIYINFMQKDIVVTKNHGSGWYALIPLEVRPETRYLVKTWGAWKTPKIMEVVFNADERDFAWVNHSGEISNQKLKDNKISCKRLLLLIKLGLV